MRSGRLPEVPALDGRWRRLRRWARVCRGGTALPGVPLQQPRSRSTGLAKGVASTGGGPRRQPLFSPRWRASTSPGQPLRCDASESSLRNCSCRSCLAQSCGHCLFAREMPGCCQLRVIGNLIEAEAMSTTVGSRLCDWGRRRRRMKQWLSWQGVARMRLGDQFSRPEKNVKHGSNAVCPRQWSIRPWKGTVDT